jgi:TolA-binding protein
MKNLVVSLAVIFFFSASANSQNFTPIVEANSSLDGPSLTEVSLPEENQASKLASNQFDVMQDLRDEVRSLRGLVEELSYDLQKMKQRQLDDYLDIDRRLSIENIEVNSTEVLNSEGELVKADNADDSSQPILTSGDPALHQTPVLADSVRDYEVAVRQDYEAASNKLLKDRNIDSATVALNMHLVDFPDSPFTANAHYWLGEIYLLKGDTELARKAFKTIVDQFPQHPKSMDSNFKLGKIYFQLGDRAIAEEFLLKAIESPGGTATKAQKFLEQNF